MEQIIYQMGDVWQARNFNEKRLAKSKNFTSGNVNHCLHIYGSDRVDSDSVGSSPLVIVEDPVSAIRIGATHDAMPLLGSHLATERLNSVARLYSSLIVWLDSDKLKEARAIARRAQLIGMSANVIYTELDPKCYPNEQLAEILS